MGIIYNMLRIPPSIAKCTFNIPIAERYDCMFVFGIFQLSKFRASGSE